MLRFIKMIQRSICQLVGVITGLFLTIQGPIAGQAVAGEIEMSLYRVESYVPRFSTKGEMNRHYRPQLNQLKKAMHSRMLDGENLTCASQIYEEAH